MSRPGGRTATPPQRVPGGGLIAVSGGEMGVLVRRLRRRQRLSRRRLSDRVMKISGDQAVTPDRLRLWEIGREVPDGYWRGWLAAALGVPREVLDRAARVTDEQRRTRRRMRVAARGRPVPGGAR